jgi:hypothetical protein
MHKVRYKLCPSSNFKLMPLFPLKKKLILCIDSEVTRMNMLKNGSFCQKKKALTLELNEKYESSKKNCIPFLLAPFFVLNSNSYVITLCIFLEAIFLWNSLR